MPKIKIEKKTQIPIQTAFEKVKAMMQTDPDLKKLDPSCQFQFNDAECKGTGKGKLFSAVVSVGASGIVSVEVELPLMLTPAKAMVEKTLEKKLKIALGET